MDEPINSHELVAELLRLLPGLEVQRAELVDGFAHFWMKIDSIDSLGRLVNHVTFCNTGLEVELADLPAAYGGPPPAVRFTLRLAHDADPANVPSQLEILGIFLTRDLKALGLLPQSRAEELQRQWNAVVN